MAIRLIDEYVNAEAADANYPQGSFKNATGPTSLDGTPLEKRWANDMAGFFQRLLALAGITPSGAPDNALTSDYFNSMERLFARFPVYNDSGANNAYVANPAFGAPVAAYYDGLGVCFKALASNTGASTLRVGGLAVKSITTEAGAALAAGNIRGGEYATAIYRASTDRFELVYMPECQPGSIRHYAGAGLPAGFLDCNGAAINRTTYSALFAAIGTVYGAGNGSTTFNLPDFRGEFLRGYDNGRGVDTGRGIGTYQEGTHITGDNGAVPAVHGIGILSECNTDVPDGSNRTIYYTSAGSTLVTATSWGRTRPRNVAVRILIKY